MIVALYESVADVTPARIDLSWDELVELLTTFEEPPRCSVDDCRGRDCPAKLGQAWSPVDLDGPRANENVRVVTACVLDLDHLRPEDVDGVLGRVSGVACIAHMTHSHSADDQCLRLAITLSRPVAPSEWQAVRSAVVAGFDLPADPRAGDLSRLYFRPTRRLGAPSFSKVFVGAPVDVDAALARTPPPSSAAGAAASAESSRSKYRAEAIRRYVGEIIVKKACAGQAKHAELLQRMLDGSRLAEKGERDAGVFTLTNLLATWLPPDVTWSDVVDVVSPCVAAMDCEPEGVDAWVKVARAKFERMLEARVRESARRKADEDAIREVVSARVRSTATADAADAGDDGAWQSKLILKQDGLRICEENAWLILSHAPEVAGKIRWNVVKRVVEAGGPFAGICDEVLPEVAAAFMQREYQFFGNALLAGRAILRVAYENPRDPLHEWLSELAWDGDARAETFFVTHFGSPDTPYVRCTSRRWLVSLVARALSPGCKCDTVLVMEGRQGVKKSTALASLVGQEYFLDTAIDVGSKDFLQAMSGGTWLIELGELASLNRVEVEHLRQVVSSRYDKYRPPYGRAIVTSPRRCVLVGTTNAERYLRDPHGHRRFWPVETPAPDVRAIERDREQVLAEAVALFRSGERWWFEDGEASAAAEEAESREEGSTALEVVDRWWHEMQPSKRPRSVTTIEVAEAALRLPVDRFDRRIRAELGSAMSKLGFTSSRVRSGSGRRAVVYLASEELLKAPARRRLQAVP